MNHGKGRRVIRKPYILLVMMLLIVLPIHSQVFRTQKELDSERDGQWTDKGLIIPIREQDFDESEFTPVGSGFALLAALGGAYLLGKKSRNKK